jgi:fatty-acyl-CoA synthase
MIDYRTMLHSDNSSLVFSRGAVSGGFTGFTFMEIVKDSRRRAHALQKIGVERGHVIAAMLPLTAVSYQTLLGAMAAATPALLNYFLEAAPLIKLIRELGATWLLTADSAEDDPAYSAKIHAILSAQPDLKHLSFAHDAVVNGINLEIVARDERDDQWPQNLAISRPDRTTVIFHTGGSTGQPKLVPYSERACLDIFDICGRALAYAPNEVVLGGLPLFHVSGSLVAGLVPILAGSRLIVPSAKGLRDAAFIQNYWKIVSDHSVTVSACVPTALAAISAVPITSDISSLKRIFSGGAAAALGVTQALSRAAPAMEILEGWGMTETAGLCTLNPTGRIKAGSAGLPFPGIEIAIRGPDSERKLTRPCQRDEIGEIVIKGPTVIERYLHPRAGSFTDDGWLITGDLGRVDDEGYLWITGRVKDLIIRSGHNIDPAPIENLASQHPSVLQAAAVGYPDPYAGELPVLYAEVRPNAQVTEEEVLLYMRKRIEERAGMPKRVFILDKLPLSGPGKIAKTTLRHLAICHALREALVSIDCRESDIEVQVRDDIKRGTLATVKLLGSIQITKHLLDDIQETLSRYTIPFEIIVAPPTSPTT